MNQEQIFHITRKKFSLESTRKKTSARDWMSDTQLKELNHWVRKQFYWSQHNQKEKKTRIFLSSHFYLQWPNANISLPPIEKIAQVPKFAKVDGTFMRVLFITCERVDQIPKIAFIWKVGSGRRVFNFTMDCKLIDWVMF